MMNPCQHQATGPPCRPGNPYTLLPPAVIARLSDFDFARDLAAAQPDSSDDSTTTTAASALSRQPAKVKVFATSFIWTETRVLLRILYKSKNQHRQAGFFHRLSLVKRLLGRLFLMEQWICGNAHGDHSNKDDNGDDGDEDDSAINKGTPRASSEVDFLGTYWQPPTCATRSSKHATRLPIPFTNTGASSRYSSP